VPALVGQHQPGRAGVQHIDTRAAQLDQQLDDVEVADQGVGKDDEGLAEPGLALLWSVMAAPSLLLSVSLIVGPKP
jgi:hypothetical protein